MSTAGQRLHLRLFLEGIEVPIVACQVQCNINAPATASIQVVPGDSLYALKARTMVHVFFWDFNQDIPSPGDGDPIQGDLQGYKLLYSGEVIGLSLSKTPMSRSAVLQCADFSTYWDTTYQIFISYGPNGNFLTESSAAWAGGNAMFDDIMSGHAAVMNEYLQSRTPPKSEGLQDVKGLMAGIIKLLEAMGGVPNHVHGVNDFFTIAEMKNHILQQIVAEQNDDTAQQIFDSENFMQWLTSGMTSLGELVSFRDMLKLLFNWIYYEVTPNPAPRYVPGADETSKTVDTSSESVFPDDIRDGIIAMDRTAALQMFDQQVNSVTNDGKAVVGNKTAADRAHDSDAAKSLSDLTAKYIGTAQLDPKVKNKLQVAQGRLDTIVKTSSATPRSTINKLWLQVTNAFGEALELGGLPRNKIPGKKKQKNKAKVDRLYTQIFRPDCFFAAPPKCNVLFPEQVTSFNYNRNFLQEVSRLRLSVGMFAIGNGDGLLSQHFYAPATKDIVKLAQKQGNAGIRALLPWEMYAGILPKFEHISEVSYYSNKRERQLKKNVKGAAASYSQRAANFNFFKYRFAARAADVTAKFSPQLVCGFPGLVIDKPFIPDPQKIADLTYGNNPDLAQQRDAFQKLKNDTYGKVEFLAKQLGAPTQYLGMIAGLAHNIDQQSGSTSASFTHARSHRVIEDEFLNAFSSEVSKSDITTYVTTTLDAETLLSTGDHKLLKFLLDATPQDIQQQMKKKEQADATTQADASSNFKLSSRPTGVPQTTQVDSASPFSLLTAVTGQPSPADQTPPISESISTGLRGGSKISTLKGARTKIYEPDPYSTKLKIGDKGPLGNKIVQIQLLSDAVMQVDSNQITPARSKSKNAKNQTSYLWRKIVIIEEKKVKSTVSRRIPVEESLRPSWFSPLYSNFYIGDQIYGEFLGCGSLVDESLFVSPTGAGAFGTTSKNVQEILGQLEGADNDPVRIRQILEDAKAQNIVDIPDIETSTDVLAYVYGEVKRLGLDAHRFVAQYTGRPIATLENIFGSADLAYERRDNKLVKTAGTGGFHSTAVIPPPLNQDLLGLMDNPDENLPRLRDKGKKGPIDKTLDPRPGRRASVQAYVDELQAGRGSLGIGLVG